MGTWSPGGANWKDFVKTDMTKRMLGIEVESPKPEDIAALAPSGLVLVLDADGKELLSQNADVVTHHTDSTAAVQAAEAKKVYAIGYHSDMSKYGPNAQLTAVTHHWGNYYTKVAQSAIDGKWQQDNVWGGIKDGMIKLAPFNKVVPQDVQDLVNKTAADIGAD